MMLEVTRRGVQDLNNWPITSVGQTNFFFLIPDPVKCCGEMPAIGYNALPFSEDGSGSYQCLTIAEGHPN